MKLKIKVIAILVCAAFALSMFGCTNRNVGEHDETNVKENNDIENSESVEEFPNEDKPYYFALLNSDYMTKEDMGAVNSIIASYSDHLVVVIDVKNCEDASDVYEILCNDRGMRGKDPDGIQIFGNAEMVPSFEICYKIAFENQYDTGNRETYLTDFFYSNFENDIAVLEEFSVADNFEKNLGVVFNPKWQVVRLPIAGEKYSHFVETYREYMKSEQYGAPIPVSISNSIFAYDISKEGNFSGDDYAYLLYRAENEWKLINGAKLYANTQGFRPSPYAIHGNSSTDAMTIENKAGICEFFFAGHGSETQLVRTVFEFDPESKKLYESRENFLYITDLNRILKSNPYYINLWSCDTAANMQANLVTEAFDGNCIGAFAGTSLLANNGCDVRADMEDMQSSTNILYFHYVYLSSLKAGLGRSQAFFEAQKKFADAAIEYAKQPVNYSANYQCGFSNLITYQNFGIIDPEGEMAEIIPSAEGIDKPLPFTILGRNTGGQEIGERTELTSSVFQQSGSTPVIIKKVTSVILDNGNLRIFVELESKKSSFARSLLMHTQMDLGATYIPAYKNILFVTDIPEEKLKNEEYLYLMFESNSNLYVAYSLYGFHRIISAS